MGVVSNCRVISLADNVVVLVVQVLDGSEPIARGSSGRDQSIFVMIDSPITEYGMGVWLGDGWAKAGRRLGEGWVYVWV